jgi:hypothetical protein
VDTLQNVESAIGNPQLKSAIGSPNRQAAKLNQQPPIAKSAVGNRQSEINARCHNHHRAAVV